MDNMTRFSSFMLHCCWTVTERLIRWIPHPRLRACAVARCGASIGKKVRLMEVFFTNPHQGFANLTLSDNVYIGGHCIFDLTAPIEIGARTSVSPGCLFLTHSDPGSMLGNCLYETYPKKIAGIRIGHDCWIGAGTICLSGVVIGDGVVVGSGSLVNSDIPNHCVAVGNPVRIVKKL
jgi:acetyltransferase-like isoleucine patch superfamily enzyme